MANETIGGAMQRWVEKGEATYLDGDERELVRVSRAGYESSVGFLEDDNPSNLDAVAGPRGCTCHRTSGIAIACEVHYPTVKESKCGLCGAEPGEEHETVACTMNFGPDDHVYQSRD